MVMVAIGMRAITMFTISHLHAVLFVAMETVTKVTNDSPGDDAVGGDARCHGGHYYGDQDCGWGTAKVSWLIRRVPGRRGDRLRYHGY